ncbi:MAG: ATP-dependent Clp protease ATP-binding subunit, partial [Peptostreptococcales bacterium]
MEWYGKFSPAAKRVLNYAQEEAIKLGHSLIGSEHLLLGLIREEEGIACEALYNFGVEEQDVRETINNLLGKSNGGNGKVLGFSQRTSRIIDIAYKDAKKAGNGIIGPEHLLIGIITEGPGVGVKVLLELSVDLQGLMNEIREIMQSEDYEELQEEEEGSSMVEKYGKDLTALAREGKVDPVIGRDSEIERVVQILNRRTKNNPCLVGEPGVGKTAIAEGLAQRIVEGNVNEYLQNKKIISIEMSSMLAGAKFRGEFEERLKKVIDEVVRAKDIILFIDEIHTIIGAGAAEGAIDASNILKPALARGEIQLIGATTFDEYRKRIEKDSALERRLQRVVIEEPDRENSIQILKGLKERYENHHRVKITEEAIIAAVDMSSRYITDRFLPDKAV